MLDQFRQLYGSAEHIRVFRAPGRVNLIGEHIDYNLGFVLPVALDRAVYVAAAPSADGKLRIYSEHRKQMQEWRLSEISALQPAKSWMDYPIGVAQELIRGGFPLEPMNLLIRSTVPEGSGLSSSAALEIACALAMLGGRPIEKLELARLCWRAEHNFAGMPCGIMDQYASIFGRAQTALELDCRRLQHRLVPLPAEGMFAAVNTMVKHTLASSAYKERVEQCEAAMDQIRRRYPEAISLCDVTAEQLDSIAGSLHPIFLRRARHVITENARVRRFTQACERAELTAMGELMEDSHRSLRDDYEVSCAELDFLVEKASAISGVYGARMTGAGFGGCLVVLLRKNAWPQFCEEITVSYQRRFATTPETYPCTPSEGAGELKNSETIPALG